MYCSRQDDGTVAGQDNCHEAIALGKGNNQGKGKAVGPGNSQDKGTAMGQGNNQDKAKQWARAIISQHRDRTKAVGQGDMAS
jgi:hypothetical protein